MYSISFNPYSIPLKGHFTEETPRITELSNLPHFQQLVRGRASISTSGVLELA